MTDHDNKTLVQMLHAWELGLLTSDEESRFEQLLLENDQLFEEARNFEDAIRLLKTDPAIRLELERYMAATGGRSEIAATGPRGGRPRSFLSTALFSGAAVCLLLVLVLTDWQFHISPSDPVMAATDRLAVLPFEAIADYPDSVEMGSMVADLLTTDLAESHLVQVVSGQRLRDLNREAGISQFGNVGLSTGMDLARKAEAKWVVVGSVTTSLGRVELATSIVEVSTGKELGHASVSNNAGESVFALIDELTVKVKESLFPDSLVSRDTDRPIANLMTPSVEATRHYFKGLELYDRFYLTQAVEAFKKAVESDSSFAMAYYYLAKLRDTGYSKKAMKYSDKAGRLDRLFIYSQRAAFAGDRATAIDLLRNLVEQYPDIKLAHHELYRLGDDGGQPGGEIRHLRRALELDPGFPNALNEFAYYWTSRRQFDSALIYIDRYREVLPGQANPWDSRGEVFFLMGQLDSARVSFRRALELDPDFHYTKSKLGHLAVIQGDTARADSIYGELATDSDLVIRAEGRSYLAYWRIRSGHFETGYDSLAAGITYGKVTGVYGPHIARIHMQFGFLEQLKGRPEAAVEAFEKAEVMLPHNPVAKAVQGIHTALAMIDAGRIEEAQAKHGEIAQVLRGRSDADLARLLRLVIDAKLEQPVKVDLKDFLTKINVFGYSPLRLFMVARLSREVGDYRSELEALELTRSVYAPLLLPLSVWEILGWYQSGLAHEALGEKDEAINAYEVFLDYWGEADWDLHQVEDARRRLNNLR